jgi:hypothetical protein
MNMIRLLRCGRYWLLLMALLCCCACRQPQSKPLKQVDKATLLKMVKSMAQTLARKGGNMNDGLKLLQSYTKSYDLVIKHKTPGPVTPATVQVSVYDGRDMNWFAFDVPVKIQQQLTFNDLKNAYGSGIESPPVKEPISFSVMYEVHDARTIAIISESRNLPSAVKPGIFNLLIML